MQEGNAKAIQNSEVYPFDQLSEEHRKKSTSAGTKAPLTSFFGIGHRMRKEKMEEQVNKELKQGWRRGKDH